MSFLSINETSNVVDQKSYSIAYEKKYDFRKGFT